MGKTTAAYTAKRITRSVVIFAFVMTLLASCLSVEATPAPPPAPSESPAADAPLADNPAAAADAHAVDSPPPEEAYDPSGA